MPDDTATQPTLSPDDPKVLRGVPIFQALSDEEVGKILVSDDCFPKKYPPGRLVIREGEIGDCMFVELGGAVEVLVKKSHSSKVGVVAVLHQGDFFGEEALLPWRDGRRNASVRTVGNSLMLHIGKRHVLYGLQKGIQSLCASKVFGTSMDSLSDLMAPREEDVMVEDHILNPLKDTALETMRSCRIFQSLSEKEMENYKGWTRTEDFRMGDYIIREGEPGRYLYLLLKGRVAALYCDSSDKLHVLATLKEGQYFGEQALMPGSNKRSNSYVRAETDCEVLKVTVKTFNVILRRDQALFTSLKKFGDKQRLALRKLSQA